MLARMEDIDLSPVDLTRPGGVEPDDHTGLAAPHRRRGRASGIAVGVLAVLVLAAFGDIWQRWGQFNPRLGSSARAAAGIPINPVEHPWYFPILLLHVMGATVALATCVLQVWPGLRRRHPRVHRNVGRVYVFAGVYPATFFGLAVEMFWPFSAATAVQQVFLALLWLFVTTYGWMLVRRGRIVDHRRWMLRSFALTTSVMVETAIEIPIDLLFRTVLHTELAGSKYIFMQVSSATDNWLGMVLAILAVEWWFERERLRRRSATRRPAAEPFESTADAAASTVSAS
jgi:uncharacterized membrane protein YozB (DUF420 family)